MTYCYRCPECGATRESNTRDWTEWCACRPLHRKNNMLHERSLVLMVRDYRAEAVMIGAIR
jgi:hypothetical protein